MFTSYRRKSRGRDPPYRWQAGVTEVVELRELLAGGSKTGRFDGWHPHLAPKPAGATDPVHGAIRIRIKQGDFFRKKHKSCGLEAC